jgi:hypothetical protein
VCCIWDPNSWGMDFFSVLVNQPWVLCMLGKHSPTELYVLPPFTFYFFILRQVPAKLPELVSNSWSSCLHLLSSWNYRHVPLCLASHGFQLKYGHILIVGHWAWYPIKYFNFLISKLEAVMSYSFQRKFLRVKFRIINGDAQYNTVNN